MKNVSPRPGSPPSSPYDNPIVFQTSTAKKDISEEWTPLRRLCGRALRSNVIEFIVASLILLNIVVVVVETNSSVDGGHVPQWARTVDVALLLIYVLELLLRLYVWRLHFFYMFFNVMDFMIVIVDVFFEAYSLTNTTSSTAAIAPLRIFRLARLARGVKVIIQFPQLALLVKGMYRAMSAIFWGFILLASALTVFGILAVHFIHPLNQQVSETGLYDGCDRCERAFESVGQSMLTFVQQIIAGDSWGLVTIPIIEKQPLSTVFFATVYVIVCLAIMNVILSVIVDSAMKVSQDDLQEVIRAKNDEFRATVAKFKTICMQMDTDASGDLTFDEILLGYNSNTSFNNQLAALDIREEDLQVVFDILDKDGDGKVDYQEFTQELFRMKADSMHTLLVFIRFYVLEIRKGVHEQLRVLKSEIFEKIAQGHEFSDQLTCTQKAAALPVQRTHSRGPNAEEKQVGSRRAEHVETASSLGEELRRLRDVISEDLVHSVKDVVQESETHTRILASIARDFPAQFGGILAAASSPLEAPCGTLASSHGRPKKSWAPPPEPHQPHGTLGDRSSWAGGLAPVSPLAPPGPSKRGCHGRSALAEQRRPRFGESCCVTAWKVPPESLVHNTSLT